MNSVKFNVLVRLGSVVIALVLLNSRYVHSQAQMPKILSPSPNAAALGKFGDIPVSHHTGTSSISIPLYTIESGDIKVPITLDYHTGGIRIKELAGWTGLGWALNGGGVINRQLKDKDDLVISKALDLVSKGQPVDTLWSGSQFQIQKRSEFLMWQGGSGNPGWSSKIRTSSGDIWDFTSFLGSISGYDLEYDVFTYNFPGASGKFIINKNGVPIISKREDILITPPSSTAGMFKIKDAQGFEYQFDKKEIASLNPNFGTYTTSWYMSKIISPKGNVIELFYSPTVLPTLANESSYESQGGAAASSTTVTSTTFNTAYILSRISFDGGAVEFQMDSARTDYAGKRITGMKVVDGGNVVRKEYEFQYSYFDNWRMRLDKVVEKSGSTKIQAYRFDYNIIPSAPALDTKDFDHWGYYNGRGNSTNLPRYLGPAKMSPDPTSVFMPYLVYDFVVYPGANRSVDPNNQKIFSLKSVEYPTGGRVELEYEANTYTNDLYEGPINYDPKDGSIELFTSDPAVDLSGNLSSLIPSNAKNVKLVLAFICNTGGSGDGCASIRGGLYDEGSIYATINNNTLDIQTATLECGGPQCNTASLIVNPFSTYTLHIGSQVLSADFYKIRMNLTWYEPAYNQSKQNNYEYAGGLRIKSIKTLDHTGEVVSTKTYSYNKKVLNPQGQMITESAGKLISSPQYWRTGLIDRYVNDLIPGAGSAFEIGNPTSNYWRTSFERFSNSSVPPNIVVGYSQVIEYSSGNGRYGKTVYKFFNERDSVNYYNFLSDPYYDERPQGTFNHTRKLNGSLLSKAEYKKTATGYQKMHEVVNEYSCKKINNHFSITTGQMTQSYKSNMYVVDPILILFVYPVFREERVLLDKTVERFYDELDSTKFLTNETLYTFGNKHEQATQVAAKDSEGNTTTTYRVFSPDYGTLSSSNYGVKNLNDQHVIVPVEQYTTLQKGAGAVSVLNGTFTSYKTTTPLPDAVYALETKEPVAIGSFTKSNVTANAISLDSRYKARLNYLQYSTKGNVERVSMSDDNGVAYLWGYGDDYPIAEVKNVNNNSDIAYSSFESSSKGQWTYSGSAVDPPDVNVPATPTGKKCYSLANGNITKSSLSSGTTYVLSYWKKTGASVTVTGGTLIGTEETYSGANGWTLVKRTFNTATALTISGTGYIDELRLYPQGALMTTLTYDPLVGTTSTTDPNNKTVYYEYDSFNRLKLVRDHDGNILKKNEYFYKNQR